MTLEIVLFHQTRDDFFSFTRKLIHKVISFYPPGMTNRAFTHILHPRSRKIKVKDLHASFEKNKTNYIFFWIL